MATMAATLLRLRAARNATRAAAAAASRAAAMASRSARAAGVAARAARCDSGVTSPLKSCPTRDDGSTKPRDDGKKLRAPRSIAEYYARLSDDGIIPMGKDLESDEAVWAKYARWCKTFNKKRDRVEMARFKLFKHHAQHVHNRNTYVPADPKTVGRITSFKRRRRLTHP